MSYDATLARGSESFVAGKFGQALATGVLIPPTFTNPWPTLTASTIEAWIKITKPSGASVAVGTDANNNSAFFGVFSGSGWFASPVAGQVIGGTVGDGVWHHMAITHDGTTAKFWVDGALVGSNTTNDPRLVDVNTALGGLGGNAGLDWADSGGLLDEVRFSSVVRYAAPFTPPTGPFVDDSATIALYHLEGDGTDSHSSGPVVPPTGTYAPNDTGIVYSPYNWDVTSARAFSINSGAYFKTLVAGSPTAITLNFDMTSVADGSSYIAYRIDRTGGWTFAQLHATIPVPIPSGDVWDKHLLEVAVFGTSQGVNRWNLPSQTAVELTGITVAPSTATLHAPLTAPRTIAVLGDSITEGIGAGINDGADGTKSFAFLLGELLGAEVGVIGFGSQGFTQGGAGNVPAVQTSYAYIAQGLPRTFTPEPDVIVINEGTNDSGADITAQAVALLNGLLAAAPTAKIALLRPFDGLGTPYLQAAASTCSDPSRVTYIDTTGWLASDDTVDGIHPAGHANLSHLAPLVAQAVAPLLGGASVTASLFVNVGGTAKPIGVTTKA